MMPELTEIDETRRIPESLWARIRSEPDRAPEYIALFAAERFMGEEIARFFTG